MVCVCVFLHTHTHIRTYVCIYIHTYNYKHTHTHAHAHALENIFQGCIRPDVTAVTNSHAPGQDERDFGPQNALSHGEIVGVK